MKAVQWSPVAPEERHPLARLEGYRLAGGSLVVFLGPVNRVGARYFQLFVKDPTGPQSLEPALTGLFNIGRYPAQNWVEVMSCARAVSFAGGKRIGRDLRQGLFQALADLLPPGGHLMVEYETPEWREVRVALEAGAPPLATELGYLIWQTGCGSGLKNWYISEGWREGPRKLQGFKAIDVEQARQKAAQLLAELKAFREQPPSQGEPGPLAEARFQAGKVIGALERKARVA